MLRLTGFRSFVIGFALLAGLAAAEADDRTDCTNTATAPANGFAGCSRWIASGQPQGEDLLWAHMWRGFHLTAAGEFDRAIADYNEAIKRDPKLAPAYMGRAANYEAKGELALALADFRQALALDPQSADATTAIKRVEEKVAALAPSRPAEPAPAPAAPPAASPPQQATAPTAPPGAGYIGVQVMAVPAALASKLHISGGALVKVLVDRSPAIDSDLEEGDVIVKFDGEPINTPQHFAQLVRQTPPGTRVHLDLIHLGDDTSAIVTVGRAPDPPIEPGTGYLGVRLDDMTRQIANRYGIPERGAVVTEILDVAGDYIGLKVWDVIVKLDFDEIQNVRDLQRRIARHSPADSVSLYIIRNGKDYGVPLVFRLDHLSERWR